jgi:lysophospholipase L1-like esterase
MSKLRQSAKQITIIFLITLCLSELTLRVAGAIYNFSNKSTYNAPGKLNILCLGESTTHFGGSDSYPSILQRMLDSKYPAKFHVINSGVSGAYTDYFRRVIENLLNVYKPDITILMMGINDNYQFYTRLSNKPFSQTLLSYSYIYRFIMNSKEFKTFIAEDLNYFTYTRYFQENLQMLETQNNYKDLTEKIFLKDYNYLSKYQKMNYKELPSQLNLALSIILLLERNESNNLLATNLNNIELRHKDIKLISHHLLLDIKKNLSFHHEYFKKRFELSTDKRRFLNNYIKSIIEIKRLEYKVETRVSKIYNIFNSLKSDTRTPLAIYQSLDSIISTLSKKRIVNKHELYKLKETKENITVVLKSIYESGSKVVFMQYPLRDIKKVKTNFKADLYISNKLTFQEALKSHDYSELFTDSFAYDFGHTTKLGSTLIAKKLFTSLDTSNFVGTDIKKYKTLRSQDEVTE